MPDTRVAWFHCFSGVSGDMALGALVDAGADLDAVASIVRALPVPGWSLDAVPVRRGGVAATKVHVRLPAPDHRIDLDHRTWRAIRALLDTSALPERVRTRATDVFTALAEAEGALHRTSPDDVAFHEVGALDAIVDVVGTCAALEVLDVDEVRCSPISVGLGTVTAAHGTLPNPAPAVVRMLAAAGAPVHGTDSPVELTTPTGAALMVALAAGFGPLPDMRPHASGFGAGAADPDGAVNATQVVIGTVVSGAGTGTAGSGQPIVVLEATVDDVSGEVLGTAVAALLDAGALDAWIAPVVMKKGRPGHVVAALSDTATAARVAECLRRVTGSLGVRATAAERWPAVRTFVVVDVAGHPVRVKVSPVRAKAEHDDVVAVAATTGRSIVEIAARAEAAWWSGAVTSPDR